MITPHKSADGSPNATNAIIPSKPWIAAITNTPFTLAEITSPVRSKIRSACCPVSGSDRRIAGTITFESRSR